MNSRKNNSNEFELGKAQSRLRETPYVTLKKEPPKGYLNPLQMPLITDNQREKIKESLSRRGG